MRVSYEWDAGKGAVNARKHGVHFADAVGVFEDPSALTVPDEHPTEERWLTLGTDYLGRILVLSYTIRGEAIRLISARKATARERKEYER